MSGKVEDYIQLSADADPVIANVLAQALCAMIDERYAWERTRLPGTPSVRDYIAAVQERLKYAYS